MTARWSLSTASRSGLAVALAGTALALVAAPAHAADPADTTFTPVSADLIGVGSDTSQQAVFLLANGYNAQTPAPTARIATFAATGGGQITLPSGAINRPNGSGAGKALLYGTGNNTDVDFARSSSALSTAEVSAGLQAFPFALDTLVTVVSGTVATNAPTSLTAAQLVAIYKGETTNWNQIGGKDGVIAPKIPQAGSGSRTFFLAQLQAANGGVAVALGSNVAEIQENSATPIQSDANAVAPFSEGLAGLAGSALRIEGGFKADRALYNVVRGTDLGNAEVQKVFGETGFVCSDAARVLIEQAGFKQLARSDKNGVCGQATQAATSNFTINTAALTDDTAFTPKATDLIGVGSDTSQHALYLLATTYNSRVPAPTNRVATYAAIGGGKIQLPTAAINRPNGSGAGKALLYGTGNNTDVDFARSSSALSTAEVSAGLQAFPFAVDTLGTVVSGSVASNAPATITPAQLVSIYKGETTNWSQIGGTAGVIKPLIPQSGSGTRSFFAAQLQAANGGVAVTLGSAVAEIQENDDTPIKSDPNAIAPFSAGRAAVLGSTLRVLDGFSPKRALYNVVRGTDLADPDVQKVFGVSGFVCSDDAAELIEEAGFEQLARTEANGVCGQATQAATSNFTVNEAASEIPTTTTVAAGSGSPRTVRIVAQVQPTDAAETETPTGSVSFVDTATGNTVGTSPLIGGVATLNLSNVAPASYTFQATYTPADGTDFLTSQGTSPAVAVQTTSSLKETFATTVARGKRATGTVTVTLAGTSEKATGKVQVKRGSKVIASGTLRGGAVKITLPKLAKGRNALTLVWAGDATASGASRAFSITQK